MAASSSLSLGELAVRYGCELHGDPAIRIERVASLGTASPGSIGFIVNARWRESLKATQASAVVLDRAMLADCRVAALVHRNPHAVFARIAQELHPLAPARPGRHPSAVIAAGADIDPTAEIQPLACVGAGVRIGPRCVIGPGSVVGARVDLGADVRVHARVTICDGVRIGPRCILHPGAVIGGDGFGHAQDAGQWVRVPQVGSVVLGADVEVGCNTAIDRGALGDTVIEDGVKIDNLVQVGHNCRIGAHTAIAGKVGLAGSTIVGKRCQFAGDSGAAGHLTICDDVIVTARAVVTSSIDKPGMYSSLFPAEPAQDWRRFVAEFKRIARLRARVKELERAAGRGHVEESGS
jgi:UDP-3-O-[3-hydroxymyristoyl] glucosamine N-acyltransferase